MSILFADARLSTQPPRRSTAGLCLSVSVHAIVVVLIAVTIGAPATPPAPRMRPLRVFLPPVTLPSDPVVTPRLPAPPPPPPPVRELARAEAPKPLPASPIAAKPVEPAPAPLVPAAPTVERPIEKPEVQRPIETGLFERTNGARPSQTAAVVSTGGFGSATAPSREAANGAVTTGGFSSGPRPPRAANAFGEVQTAGFDLRASAPVRPL